MDGWSGFYDRDGEAPCQRKEDCETAVDALRV